MTDTSQTERGEISLSLEQRTSLTSGASTWRTVGIPGVLPSLVLADGPHGVRHHSESDASIGIGDSVPATCFPPAVGLGSSWNPDLAWEVGAAIGREARALGVDVILGPGLNIKRSPLCGRNFEYLSEDPHLTALMGAGLVRGLQEQGVGATIKHFAVNNQETDRMRVSAEVDERTLREIYLPAFEHVVRQARPYAVMAAYNQVNGVYASEHRWLLTELLRGEWGFDGLVMSDWGAVNDRVAALRAGLDLEMPPSGTDPRILAAVLSGGLDESLLDATCARLATLAGRVAQVGVSAPDLDAHDALARRAAAESVVLLKNESHVLPLDRTAALRVAVIGEFARTPRIQGGGSSRVVPTRTHTPLDALRNHPAQASIEFAAGFTLAGSPDATLLDEAVAVATRADVVVAFLGLPDASETEGADRTSLDLPADQRTLLTRLADTRTPTVVVLSNGGVVAVEPWEHEVDAVLEAWLLGQAGGAAIADVLFGAVSPSGRLTETIPLRLQDTPSYLHFPGHDGVSRYGEGRYVGYRGYDTLDVPVSYPFGHGLAYSRFDYSALAVTENDDGYCVRFTITNVGDHDAAEVPQVYVAVDEVLPSRPAHELRAFTKVFLAAGERREVALQLRPRDLATWDESAHRWSVAPGRYTIEVGASSRDIRLRADIVTDGDRLPRGLTTMSTVSEWLAHPIGSVLLGKYLSAIPRDLIERAPELRPMVGQMPIVKLCSFGLGLDEAKLATMLEAVHTAATDPTPYLDTKER